MDASKINNYSYTQPVNPYATTNAANAAKTEKAEETAAVQTTTTVAADNKAAVVKKNQYQPDLDKISAIYAEDRAQMQGIQSLVHQLKYQSSNVSLLSTLSGDSKDSADIFGKLLGADEPGASSKTTMYELSGMKMPGMKDYFSLFVRNDDGSFSVDLSSLSPESRQALISKAQENISEDGYYGVNKTSERILNFAKAITGGDPSKIEEMKKMVQKAFDEVGSIFGGYNNMPDISKQTYDSIMKGFEDWSTEANAVTN